MSVELRPYQIDLVDKVRAALKGGARSVLVQSATGSGKTHVIAHMMAGILGAGQNVWLMAHRAELVEQADDVLKARKVRHGVMARGVLPTPGARAQVASVPWLVRRMKDYQGGTPPWAFWDEAHHCPAKSWGAIFDQMLGALHVGFTATPLRLDGRGLGGQFDALVTGPSVKELIALGWLAKYKLFAPRGVTVKGLRTVAGDWVTSQLQALVDRPSITGSAVQQYRWHAAGKRALVFCAGRSHSKHVALSFQTAGIAAQHLDGDTPRAQRAQVLADFRRGKVKVLCNVDLFGEGFDLPALDCVVMLRPTQSLRLYLQQVGRAMRPEAGKEHAIILDHVGNCERFGRPDKDREWSLEGDAGTAGANERVTPDRICPFCGFVQDFGTSRCAECGKDFPLTFRPLSWQPGDLVEVDPEWLDEMQDAELKEANSLERLTILAAKRGLTAQWALRIHMQRCVVHGYSSHGGAR